MANATLTLNDGQSGKSFAPSSRMRKIDHRFFTAMAVAISIGVFGGFTRTYFAKTYFHSAPLSPWLHIHGAVFTTWILFYLLQNLLAMNGGMKLHRRLGIVGAILASGVVFLGLAITVRQAREGRFFPFPDQYGSIAVSTGQMVLFGAMIATALILRRDGETHKRLILMSTQLFFFPAFGRLLHGLVLVTLLLALCFYLAGPIYDLITRRRIHPAYRWGVPLLILTMPPFAVAFSRVPLWQHFADKIVK